MVACISQSTKQIARDRFLDAAERILLEEGRAGLTTRRVARAAEVNHGLVHYYFGSVDNLTMAVLDRFSERLVERQRAIYSLDLPFIDRWRAAMDVVEEDLAAGYPKIWNELQAVAWNHPELRERMRWVNAEWRTVLADAFTTASVEYGLSPRAVEPIVTLVMTFSQGLVCERLIGADTGHAELRQWIEGWLLALQEAASPERS